MDVRRIATRSAHARPRPARRSSTGLAFVFIAVMVAMSGCGASGNASMSLSRGLSNAVKTALSNGVDTAATRLDDYADDFARAVDRTAIVPPSTLQKAVREADQAVGAGATLTDEESRLIAVADEWILAYNALNKALKLAVQWEAAIPDDALRLAAAGFLREPSAEFRSYVVTLESKVLKGLMCTAARHGLDEAGEAQAQGAAADYEYIGRDSNEVASYVDSAVAAWEGAQDVLDILGLANASIAQHNSYIEGIVGVIDSPTTSIAAANIMYFRSCVVRNR